MYGHDKSLQFQFFNFSMMAKERIVNCLLFSSNPAFKAARRSCNSCLRRCYAASRPSEDTIMNVFDRKTKRHQRNVAAKQKDHHLYDYLKDEIADRLVDRLSDIPRQFPVVLDLGCGKGHISKYLPKENIDILYQCDMSKQMLERCTEQELPTATVLADEEALPFYSNTFDAVLSSLSLHWVNNLPGVLQKVKSCLKDDGVFLAALFGGDTLYELRSSLQQAEIEQEGGFGPHISPLAQMTDCGNLLTRAGFTLTTVDYDDVIIDYPGITELMQDLKGMGENNAAWNRKNVLHHKTVKAASKIYKDYYGNDDGSIPATYQVLYMIGWKPSASQPKPLERGSADVSFKDLHSVIDEKKSKKPS